MVRTAIIAAAVLAGLSLSTPAQAYNTGNELYSDCQEPDASVRKSVCLGFIIGVANRDRLERWMESGQAYTCEMAGVTAGQMLDVVVRHLRVNPETRHQDAAGLVGVALQRAFCSQN